VTEGKVPGTPASVKQLDAFESANRVRLPQQVRFNYSIMNGAPEFADGWPSWVRFWAIGEWRRASEEYVGSDVAGLLSGDLFICADHLMECVHYVIDLDQASAHYGRVDAVGATRLGKVAGDFNDFVACVATDSEELHRYG
jgi:hypothetical protein